MSTRDSRTPKPRIELIAARVARKPRKFTQSKVARLAGLAHTRYWEIENGYRAGTPQERKRIAKALGVAVEIVFPSEVTA